VKTELGRALFDCVPLQVTGIMTTIKAHLRTTWRDTWKMTSGRTAVRRQRRRLLREWKRLLVKDVMTRTIMNRG